MNQAVARPFVVAVSCMAALALLAGCGEDASGARTTLAELQPSSYVVRDPVTTTTVPADPVAEDGTSSIEQQYTVVAGDFPIKVANLYGVPLADLCNYNGWTLPNCPEFPGPGTVINIPPGGRIPGAAVEPAPSGDTGGGTTATQPPTQTTVPPSGECTEGTYTLKSGDFPNKVANQFDITLDQLNAANANTPGYQSFIVGTEIKIPCP
jgi:LysM repeat protein